ncbi:hypothetical protein ACP43V_18695 [Vibrio genomosp. F10 str. 9ZC157]|uniref:Uncharacterized protein n=1 Tax=Vibrio genomosp. F10 str. ZF-129 TaxID=1187848 RepID=A0A1E5BAE3_9VIBR|nr:hypothetical protein [Vibrio genomosp. F10]OEE30791.1 hypothetical protein A1QO_15785 [Vibrio genomosp. F10 str. ZF-129]OEE92738.1 hypothetical protein A1QM_11600 [Vibrio genomosp. F10 str. 9ZC157]
MTFKWIVLLVLSYNLFISFIVSAEEPDRNGWTLTRPNPNVVRDVDKKYQLPMSTDAIKKSQTGYMKTLYDRVDLSSDDDGLYIYVYLFGGNDSHGNEFIIRRADRPDDKGYFSDGSTRYSYEGNPANEDEPHHMFVRHTQISYGSNDYYPGKVWSAGALEIKYGKIVWVSVRSGHYTPSIDTLDYVESTLRAWGLWHEHTEKHDYNWVPDKTNPPKIPTEKQCHDEL